MFIQIWVVSYHTAYGRKRFDIPWTPCSARLSAGCVVPTTLQSLPMCLGLCARTKTRLSYPLLLLSGNTVSYPTLFTDTSEGAVFSKTETYWGENIEERERERERERENLCKPCRVPAPIEPNDIKGFRRELRTSILGGVSQKLSFGGEAVV